MFGGGSFQLGRIFGIRIGVDFSFFLVLFLIIWSLSTYYEDVAPNSSPFVLAVVSALLFFLSILLHELGHAWVAIRNGVVDRDPVLDLSAAVSLGGEQGLLGLAFSPDGRFLFVNFTDVVGNTRVLSYAMRGDRFDGAQRRGGRHA